MPSLQKVGDGDAAVPSVVAFENDGAVARRWLTCSLGTVRPRSRECKKTLTVTCMLQASCVQRFVALVVDASLHQNCGGLFQNGVKPTAVHDVPQKPRVVAITTCPRSRILAAQMHDTATCVNHDTK